MHRIETSQSCFLLLQNLIFFATFPKSWNQVSFIWSYDISIAYTISYWNYSLLYFYSFLQFSIRIPEPSSVYLYQEKNQHYSCIMMICWIIFRMSQGKQTTCLPCPQKLLTLMYIFYHFLKANAYYGLLF